MACLMIGFSFRTIAALSRTNSTPVESWNSCIIEYLADFLKFTPLKIPQLRVFFPLSPRT